MQHIFPELAHPDDPRKAFGADANPLPEEAPESPFIHAILHGNASYRKTTAGMVDSFIDVVDGIRQIMIKVQMVAEYRFKPADPFFVSARRPDEALLFSCDDDAGRGKVPRVHQIHSLGKNFRKCRGFENDHHGIDGRNSFNDQRPYGGWDNKGGREEVAFAVYIGVDDAAEIYYQGSVAVGNEAI